MPGTNAGNRKRDPATRGRPPKSAAPVGGTSELTSALIRFSQRLANFGLGEVTDPLLDHVGDASGEIRPSR